LQISAQNYLFQSLLKAIGFVQEDTSSDAKWPIFIMHEGLIESFNPRDYGLEIVKKETGEVDLKVSSPSQTEWPRPRNGFSKTKFSGTSFTKNISTRPIEKTPVETSPESGFWFSRDNESLEPGFNLAIILDETLSIGKSHTVDLSEAKLNEKPLRIYTQRINRQDSDTKLPSNVVDGEDKGDKENKGEKVLSTNETSYETTIAIDQAEATYERSTLTLKRTLDFNNFNLNYFYLTENIVSFSLDSITNSQIELRLSTTHINATHISANALGLVLPGKKNANTSQEISTKLKVKSCLMMSGEATSLPLLIPTIDKKDQGGILPPLTFDFKIQVPAHSTESLTLLLLADDANGYSQVSGLPLKFEPLGSRVTGEIAPKIKLGVGEIDVIHHSELLLSGLTTNLAELRADPLKLFSFKLTQLKENIKVYLEDLKIVIPAIVDISLSDETSMVLSVSIELDLSTFRLKKNQLYFYIRDTQSTDNNKTSEWFDLKIFAFAFTKRTTKELANATSRDGYIDLENREILIAPLPSPTEGSLRLAFPGEMASQPDANTRFLYYLKELKEGQAEGYYSVLGRGD
jgi:hypothetical protein